MVTGGDPEIAALATVCEAIAELDGEDARRRVLDFAYARFKLGTPSVAASHTEPLRNFGDSKFALETFDTAKPFENVALLVAELYSKHGSQPFTVSELKSRADEAGLVVPARIDKTLNGAAKQGKRFYQQLGPGRYRLTVHGEAHIRETYSVRKGSANRSAASEPRE